MINLKKIYTIFILILSFSLPIKADYLGKGFLQSAQQKMTSIGSHIIKNAWCIAGTANFTIAGITAGFIAKAALEDAHFTRSLSSTIMQNSIPILLPLTCSILGLLCFNIDRYQRKLTQETENIKEILLQIQNQEPEKNELLCFLLNNVQEIKEALHNK